MKNLQTGSSDGTKYFFRCRMVFHLGITSGGGGGVSGLSRVHVIHIGCE